MEAIRGKIADILNNEMITDDFIVDKLTNLFIDNNKELLECIHNLMGHFDTPLARLKMSSDDCELVRSLAREILNKHNIDWK